MLPITLQHCQREPKTAKERKLSVRSYKSIQPTNTLQHKSIWLNLSHQFADMKNVYRLCPHIYFLLPVNLWLTISTARSQRLISQGTDICIHTTTLQINWIKYFLKIQKYKYGGWLE
jgi:hypothetical protein